MLRFIHIILIQLFLRKQESISVLVAIFMNPDPRHSRGDEELGVETC